MTTPIDPTDSRSSHGSTLMSPTLAVASVGALAMPKDIPHRSVKVRDTWEFAVRTTLILCGAFSILTTAAIIIVLFSSAWKFLTHDGVSWTEFFTGTQWNPLLGSVKHYGVLPLVIGTLLVSAVAMAVALPGGLITAVYLSEYAPRWLRSILKPVLEVLAGIPTVVYGFFALTIITPSLKDIGLKLDVYNALSAGIAVGIMCLPIVCSLSEDALQAVPRSLREGAYAVGGTRFDVAVRVVMPAALSGIVAAFLLAIARAVGETMIVALAAGSSPASFTNLKELGSAINPENSTQTMTGYMVQIFGGDASNFGIEYLSSYAVAATLFVLTFIITLIGHRVRVKYREVYE
ncbi:MAG TPA: phosphate ABC transporter permease subunit PstC [Phycisphaerales bacterium]|nr:phosphate ABC transporter permease subunit PstC [Phycisphaerales bacterium]